MTLLPLPFLCVCRAHAEFGNDWKKISEIVGRFRIACRDKMRDILAGKGGTRKGENDLDFFAKRGEENK